MTRRRTPTRKPVELQPIEVAPVAVQPAPILFPAESQENALTLLRQMKQAEAQMKSFEQQANLIIGATAIALNVPNAWRLDMRSEVWLFVPPETPSEQNHEAQ
jgi:hypothetical protein